jgi:ABC-type Co2+ transport system permease subunit
MRNSNGKSRFASSVFIASWSATVLTALLTGLELGFSITFAAAGGIALTVPTMFSVYAAAGLVEAVITAGLATALQQLQPGTVLGLKLLGGREKL